MKRFVNAFDFEEGFETLEGISEIQSGVSKTVPDMTMSLREILRRYTRGGEVATFTPVYQDNPDEFDENPDISKMDPMERLQYALDLKSAIKRTKASLEDRQKQFESERADVVVQRGGEGSAALEGRPSSPPQSNAPGGAEQKSS